MQKQISCKKQELASLQEQLHQHPEWIESHCDLLWLKTPNLKKIISRISFLEEIFGTTDSRKSPIKYHGWRFQLDNKDTNYYFRSGSNWCSEVNDVGDCNMSYDLSRQYLMDNCHETSGVLTDECLAEIGRKSALEYVSLRRGMVKLGNQEKWLSHSIC